VDLWTLSYVALWAVVAVQSLVLVVILRMFGSFYLGTRDGISRDGPSLGSTAPSFHARDLTGRTVNEPSPGIVNAFVFTSLGCDACRSGELGKPCAKMRSPAARSASIRRTPS